MDSSLSSLHTSNSFPLPDPICIGMGEVTAAADIRAKINIRLDSGSESGPLTEGDLSPIEKHIFLGLAYTVGSAVGTSPPTRDLCLAAYLEANKAGLTEGSRAWSKHAHRSHSEYSTDEGKKKINYGWWGNPSGPVATINEKSALLFDKIMNAATWRNLHWLPHQVLVYEVRVPQGYGMRWSQDRSVQSDATDNPQERPWTFRGFVEPMMENGHELGWRH